MIELGKNARLRVIKTVPFGVYLDARSLGEILLPARYVPKNTRPGDEVDVFLYLDSEDIPVATTLTPKIQVGQCALLRVVAVNQVGAFLDWGLPKDLLAPFSEQRVPMEDGRSYVVYAYRDKASNRIAASSRLSDFLHETDDGDFKVDQAVDLTICGRTPLGLKAVIDGTHLGMILQNDLLGTVNVGDRLKGFIKNVRDDGRINLRIQAAGQTGRDKLDQHILDFLATMGGSCTLTDRSTPEAIFKQFGVSKANYKKALGRLYKSKLILLNKDRVTLL